MRRAMFPLALPLALALVTAAPLASTTLGAAGDLDTSFGNAGKVTTDFGFGGGSDDNALSMAINHRGEILVAGTLFSVQGQRFALSRYTPDGALDASFGSAGRVITDFGDWASSGTDLALGPNGKIVVAGYTYHGEGNVDIALASYETNGTLDPAFSDDGRVTLDIGSWDSAEAVAVQSDGKIVTGGTSGPSFVMVLARHMPDGSLDASFGSAGIVMGPPLGTVLDLTTQSDGKIVVAGYQGVDGEDLILARYLPDGSLDPTFGSSGITTTDLGGGDAINAIALQRDGRIVAAASSWDRTGRVCRFIVARYTADGALDASFGQGGLAAETGFGGTNESANAIMVQPDGHIVAAGRTGTEEYASFDFALARYNADGSLDASFGDAGKVTTDLGGHGDFAQAVARQRGRIVVAGIAWISGWEDFALARYRPHGR